MYSEKMHLVRKLSTRDEKQETIKTEIFRLFFKNRLQTELRWF